ncbi:MAG: hypothetical protein CL573_00895 [Alphaproteobacteria bacterium]|nr:hypothetical protein [Alphaproteobacteria bacterium]|tara:strand:- start:2508 stop:2759 length:252 start_codon:yes stop_codon:yes gene_type:complete
MLIKIEEVFSFEADGPDAARKFQSHLQTLGVSVDVDEAFVDIPPQDFEVDEHRLGQILSALEADGIDHTLSMVVLGTWYLDLF